MHALASPVNCKKNECQRLRSSATDRRPAALSTVSWLWGLEPGAKRGATRAKCKGCDGAFAPDQQRLVMFQLGARRVHQTPLAHHVRAGVHCGGGEAAQRGCVPAAGGGAGGSAASAGRGAGGYIFGRIYIRADTVGYMRIQMYFMYPGPNTETRTGYAQNTQDTYRIQYSEGYTQDMLHQDRSGYIRIHQDTI